MTKPGSSIITYSRLILIGLFCLLVFSGISQAQNKKKIDILHCDLLDFNEQIISNAQRLLGNVNITVDGALMWCDSMYSYTNTNTVDAFGNVHIVRGDTLNMYADFIHYNGDTKLAKARRNVKLIDKKITLTTDSLDYSMVNDMASYNYSGIVKDSTNVLTSIIGQYYVNDNKAYFKTNVDGVTKDYKIKSETLIYYTDTKKVYIEGPTHIFNEKDTLYTEYGWYDSMKGYASLTKNPRIWNEKQKVKADSIFYDKQNGEGLAMGHARVQDIENSIIVLGNRVQYNDLTKMASATDSAVLIQYSETDSLYLHAERLLTMPDTTISQKTVPLKKVPAKSEINTSSSDTLAAIAMGNNELTADTLGADSLSTYSMITGKLASDTLVTYTMTTGRLTTETLTTETITTDTITTVTLAADTLGGNTKKNDRLVLAWYKVRFFRKDFQGKCDSLVYWSKDSTIQLYTDPVIWSNNNQITARYIEMVNRSKDPDEVRMKDDAFIIAMEDDSLRFNQIKGKNMTGFVRKNNLYKIDVNGNGQSTYYARDNDGIIGLNKAESSNITIYLTDGKVKKIAFIKSPEGEVKPLAELEESDKLLPGFNWQAEIRPKNKEDIFRFPLPAAAPEPPPKAVVPPVSKEILD